MATAGNATADVVKKGLGLGGIINLGFNVVQPIMTYNSAKKEGKSTGQAAFAAGAEFVAWQVAEPLMWAKMAFDITTAVAEAGSVIGKQNRDYVSRGYRNNFGGTYVDNQRAATMRQAGLYNIQGSRDNVRSSLGGEAKTYYRRDGQVW